MAKYTAEDKLAAVHRYLEGKESYISIAKSLNTSDSVVRNWVMQYETHGVEVFLKKSYTSYSAQFKLDVLNYMNDYGTSPNETALIFNITSPALIRKWRGLFESQGIDALESKKKGRPFMKKESKKKQPAEGSQEALLAELEYLRMENAYPKKVECLSSRREEISERQKAKVIFELRSEFKVINLIKVAGIKRSTYYYWVKQLKRPDKYTDIKEAIKEIFNEHKGRYGYRRITLELRNRNYCINHKTVRRLMTQLGLKSLVRIKKYRSYRGKVGSVAPNILERDFKASKPNEKWVTDVTEFHLFGEKLYFSPILDLFNGEIIAYNIEKRPVFPLVSKMLDQAFLCLTEGDTPILHSDLGWHYQMKKYQHLLKENHMTQSMSRKGNCLDNAVIENFFGLLKSELLYLLEFESIEHFTLELENYIYYYNHNRIKAKLKGLSPVEYRIQSLKAA
ncbi:IS3 family transposase [Cytobacillus dafuensis]|uniref:IS3 family transposase n=1 Tax=Cytobacillus dafuensis TaxID=1742359 RepID=A0A5B8Z6X6_CYTDA|nr:IS3 family transposase [Cytobacillus dafuensis]QED47943.1 IS3 family transposase [Cytobacillus dafuensis]